MGDEHQPRLRADARRNRDRIVAAAKTWFATHGPEAPTEEEVRTMAARLDGPVKPADHD